MKIISGKYRGRIIKGYDVDGTRPTMDRVKESVIATVQNKIIDGKCLDLFAGTGSFGLELLSNGAQSCIFVDKNIVAINNLKKNLINLRVSEYHEVICGDFKSVLKKMKNQFDIIFLDPPYEENLISLCLYIISEMNLLSEDGIIICEYEKENINKLDYRILKEKRYGSKNILILEK